MTGLPSERSLKRAEDLLSLDDLRPVSLEIAKLFDRLDQTSGRYANGVSDQIRRYDVSPGNQKPKRREGPVLCQDCQTLTATQYWEREDLSLCQACAKRRETEGKDQ